jgi:simple sugar transport system permease protein
MTHTARPPSPPLVGVDERVVRRSPLLRLLGRPEFGSLLGAIVVFVFFFVIAPSFRVPGSLSTTLYASSTIGMMAVSVALLMIGGEFDLSAGVLVTTASLTAGIFDYEFNTDVWVGVVVSLVVVLAVEWLNGYLLVRTGLPSFLVTLATFLMLQGVNLGLTRLITTNVASPDISPMQGFGSAQSIFASELDIGGVALKIPVLWWILFVAVATWVLLRTKVGNWIFAVGGQAPSARAVGVPVARTKIGLFMTVGFTAWFTGMHSLFAFHTVQSGEGVGNELLYIIAAVIGGCLLTGGYGSAIGSALGALIFGMAEQGIVYAGWNPDWFKFFLGLMLLLAMLVNVWVRRQAERR